MSKLEDPRLLRLLPAVAGGAGGVAAWALAWAGQPWGGAVCLAVGVAGALWWEGRRETGAGQVGSLAGVRAAVEADPSHPCAPLAEEVRRLTELVEQSGAALAAAAGPLLGHAAVGTQGVDQWEQAVDGVRAHGVSARDGFERVARQAGDVLGEGARGVEWMEVLGERNKDLLQSAETLSAAVGEVQSSVEQVHGNLYGVQQGVALLAEASDRTTDFISQVGGAMGSIRERTGQSLAMTEKVEEHARRGRSTVARVGAGVDEIRKASEAMVESVQALGEQSKEIEGILAIITDVAEETGLLSLNAAILAAQAGESGAAFAVVADQIRSLAHRTRESTKNIEELVRGIQTNITGANRGLERSLDAVSDGRAMGDEAARQLELIERAVVDSVEHVRRIAESAQEQDEKAHAMVEAAGEVNTNLHHVADALGVSIAEMDRIQFGIHSLTTLADSVRGATEEHGQIGRTTRDLLVSLSARVEGIRELAQGRAGTGESLSLTLAALSEAGAAAGGEWKGIQALAQALADDAERLGRRARELTGST